MTFDEIKHIENGEEYWIARELQLILQYKEWRNFSKVVDTAKIACKISQQAVLDHFVEAIKVVDMPTKASKDGNNFGFVDLNKTKTKKITDYKLTRYACYLIVMNGDPRKEVIALGQTYFAVKTRQQELEELYGMLTENERRLFLRGDIKQKNMLLVDAAHRAGIQTQAQYAAFQDHGYKGLYGGETAKIIAARKGLDNNEEILDYMGSAELAANIFRITQTEEKIKNEGINSPNGANAAHYAVGQAVRKAIKEVGGTLPENMPTPAKSIKELEKEERQKLGKE